MSTNIEKIKEVQEEMINDIMELQRMIYRLNDYVYHIQKYLLKDGEDNED